jgi:heterodisulfide reductase subunit D
MTDIDLEDLMENLAQCRRCGICRDAVYQDRGFDGICPVWRNTPGFETSFMRGRIQVAIALLDGTLEKTDENAESLFSCTLCGNCTQICAAEFDPAKTLEKVRAALVDVPNDVRDSLAKRIEEKDNPYDEDKLSKRNWVQELGFDVPDKGETLYFVGCTAGLRLPHIAKSTMTVLKRIGVETAVLEDEPCCGSVLLRTGKRSEAEENAKRLMESVAASGAKRILVTCAGCHRTLKKDFPDAFGIELPQVLHVMEFLDELRKKEKLSFHPLKEDTRITYHDPCHSGRELGMYEEPRNLLAAIPGVELVEMETNREAAMCCGAGGGLRSFDSSLANKIAAARVRDAEKTGAKILATACPFCELNLRDGAELVESRIQVVDLIEFLDEMTQTQAD